MVHSCGGHASTQSNARDRGLVSSLPIPYCAKSLLCVDFIHCLPKFGRYDSFLVVTCGLTCFTRAVPCNKNITGEQTLNNLVQQWFEHYRTPKEMLSHEDVRIWSDTGWYKRLSDALNVRVTTGVPHTHTFNPLCEGENRVVEQILVTARPGECVPGQVQDSGGAPVSVNVLSPALNQVQSPKHLHICSFWSPATVLVVPCTPMPVVVSVSQIAAYQVYSHSASGCLVDHLLHGICLNGMSLGSGGFLD